MKTALLVLCPDDPHWIPPDDEHLQQFLRSIHFIGEALNDRHFFTGERFLDWIAFMGCSPEIKLEPGNNNENPSFCHVHLSNQTPAIEFHCGDHTHQPRCPQCRSPVNDWKRRISAWAENSADSTWSCDTCQYQGVPWKYNWRRSAGFGRCFIEINDIFPKEAIPQQQLLDTLHSRYGVSWHYFYQY